MVPKELQYPKVWQEDNFCYSTALWAWKFEYFPIFGAEKPSEIRKTLPALVIEIQYELVE